MVQCLLKSGEQLLSLQYGTAGTIYSMVVVLEKNTVSLRMTVGI
jgi:hypothetical protein